MSLSSNLFADAPRSTVVTGDVLFRRDDPVTSMLLVEDGTVALERPLADGGHLTLNVATGGALLAEASLFAPHYHCDAVVRVDGAVRSMSRDAFLDLLMTDPASMIDLLRRVTTETQALRSRVELLRLNRLSDRLDGWLDLYGLPEKGGWRTVADAIGVTPAALYRELARRREILA